MIPRDSDLDQLTSRAIACAIEVHREMGPGLLESIYRECLLLEFGKCGLRVESERMIPVAYKGTPLVSRFRIDLLLERCLVLELKAVDGIRPVHKAQVITYLKLTGLPAGLLINFNETTLRAGLHRLDHPTRFAQRRNQRRDADPAS